jgi:hypothetical protein
VGLLNERQDVDLLRGGIDDHRDCLVLGVGLVDPEIENVGPVDGLREIDPALELPPLPLPVNVV